MKQPDSLDVGTKMDVVRHRLNIAREDLDTANLTFEAGQYRAANNRAYYSIFHTICAVLAKEGVDARKKDNNGNVFIMFDAEDGRLYLSILSAKYETNTSL